MHLEAILKELFLKKFKSVRDGKNNAFIAPCKSFGENKYSVNKYI